MLGKAAADRRSGAAVLGRRVAAALALVEDPREVRRWTRRLVRAHPAMATVHRACSAALQSAASLERYADLLAAEPDAIASAASGWALGKRTIVVATHSWSSTVYETLLRAGPRRTSSVVCAASLPGGEGRGLASRLRRDGFDARAVHDATMLREIARADVVLVGADAVCPEALVNKIETYACALAAREHDVPCYALAGTAKLLPHDLDELPAAFEATPLELFDAVITERGPMRAAAIRRAALKIVVRAF